MMQKKNRAFLKWAGYYYDKNMKCYLYDLAILKIMKFF